MAASPSRPAFRWPQARLDRRRFGAELPRPQDGRVPGRPDGPDSHRPGGAVETLHYLAGADHDPRSRSHAPVEMPARATTARTITAILAVPSVNRPVGSGSLVWPSLSIWTVISFLLDALSAAAPALVPNRGELPRGRTYRREHVLGRLRLPVLLINCWLGLKAAKAFARDPGLFDFDRDARVASPVNS